MERKTPLRMNSIWLIDFMICERFMCRKEIFLSYFYCWAYKKMNFVGVGWTLNCLLFSLNISYRAFTFVGFYCLRKITCKIPLFYKRHRFFLFPARQSMLKASYFATLLCTVIRWGMKVEKRRLIEVGVGESSAA